MKFNTPIENLICDGCGYQCGPLEDVRTVLLTCGRCRDVWETPGILPVLEAVEILRSILIHGAIKINVENDILVLYESKDYKTTLTLLYFNIKNEFQQDPIKFKNYIVGKITERVSRDAIRRYDED